MPQRAKFGEQRPEGVEREVVACASRRCRVLPWPAPEPVDASVADALDEFGARRTAEGGAAPMD